MTAVQQSTGTGSQVPTSIDRWGSVLDELDRTLSAPAGTPEYFVPLDGPPGDAVDGQLGPLPAELRPRAVELVARSEVRMSEISAEMARVADEITILGRHARASVRSGWSSSPGGADRSSSGMAHEL